MEATRSLVWCLVVIATVIGNLPITSYVETGILSGVKDVLSDVPVHGKFKSRAYSILQEKTDINKDIISLANYLANQDNVNRPVIFYGERWWLGTYVGVIPSGYSFYPFMYANSLKPMTAFFDKNHDTLVIISMQMYKTLFEKKPTPTEHQTLSVTKQLSIWLSSIHYNQKGLEKK